MPELLGRISALAFYLRGEDRRHLIVDRLGRHRVLSRACAYFGRLMSAIALAIGLCFVFTVVIEAGAASRARSTDSRPDSGR